MVNPALALAAVVGTFAVIIPMPPKPPECPELTYCRTDYFTDRSYYTLSGQRNINCIGIADSWGTPTRYTRYTEVAC